MLMNSPSTLMTLPPSLRMLSATSFFAPALTAVTATSAATPMTTPSAVRTARNQFARSAPNAIRPCSAISSARSLERERTIDLLVRHAQPVGEADDSRRSFRYLARVRHHHDRRSVAIHPLEDR